MIAILTTDELLREMLLLEAARGQFQPTEAENATVWLLDLDHPPRPLPPKNEALVIGLSRELREHPRADHVLPLPYPTKTLQALLAACRTASGADATVQHLQGAALIGGKKIELSPAEEHLFALLLQNRGQVVPEAQLIAALGESRATTNVLQVHIYRLRRKLSPYGAVTLRAVRGVGYLLH